MAFGKPNLGNGTGKKFPQNLKDGDSIFRIIPPIHTCADDGIWALGYGTHTEAVPREDDPSKSDYFTYYCVEEIEWVNREPVVLQSCPRCVSHKAKQEEFDTLKKAIEPKLKAGKVTKEQATTALKSYMKWLERNGKDYKVYMNVKFLDGTYQTVKVPNKSVKKPIDVLRKEHLNKNPKWDIIDAEQGYWLKVNRTGKGFGTEYKVDIYTEDRVIEGQTASFPKRAPLAADEDTKAEAACYDLKDLGFHKLTVEQVAALVRADGDPEQVKAIFRASAKSKDLKKSPGAGTASTTTTTKSVDALVAEISASVGEEDTGPSETVSTPDPVPAKPAPSKEVSANDPQELLRRARELMEKAKAASAAASAPAESKAEVPMAKPKPEPKPEPSGSSAGTVETKPAPTGNDAGLGDLDLDGDLSDFMATFKTGK